MAEQDRYRTQPRNIPNFAMDKPWNAPMTDDEEAALGESATLAGLGDADQAITTLLREFAGDYVQALQNGRG